MLASLCFRDLFDSFPWTEFLSSPASLLFQIVNKGTRAEVDSYSGFFDNNRISQTELHEKLQEGGVTSLVVGGLATDYCIMFTVLDALDLGYAVTVVADAVRGIDPAASAKAVADMQAAGAVFVTSAELLQR